MFRVSKSVFSAAASRAILKAAILSSVSGVLLAQPSWVQWNHTGGETFAALDHKQQRILTLDSSTWTWNGSRWTNLPSISLPENWLEHFTSMAVPDVTPGRVLFLNGEVGDPHRGGQRFETSVWDGVNWTLLKPPTSPSPRWFAAAALDAARGQVVLFGGSNNRGLLAETWTWDGKTWTLRPLSVFPPASADIAMAYDSHRQRVVLFGDVGGTWEWDGSRWAKIPTGTAPAPRGFHKMTYDPVRREVLCFGGRLSPGHTTRSRELWAWNGANWRQILSSPAPPPRDRFVFEFDPVTNKTLLFGGRSLSEAMNDIWLFDGTTWSQQDSRPEPPNVVFHTLATDFKRNRVVHFGGRSISPLDPQNQTWTFDGDRWAPTGPAHSPSPRFLHAMTWDSTREEIVLFGGRERPENSYMGDTWVWNGTDWIPKSPSVSPAPRYGHAMAHDPIRGKTVLFGGQGSACTYGCRETWLWDGVTWTKAAPAQTPSLFSPVAMAFDESRGVIILTGPAPTIPSSVETWSWDGTNWTLLSSSDSSGSSMVYDPSRSLLVLARETNSHSKPMVTSTWTGSAWLAISPVQSPGGYWAPAMAFDPVQKKIMLTTYSGAWGTWHFNSGEAGALVPVSLSSGLEKCTGLTVDGLPVELPAVMLWPAGSQHTLKAADHMVGETVRCSFTGWQDGAPAERTYTVPPLPTSLTANFKAAYRLTLRSSYTPPSGTVLVSPASPDGFYEDGTSVVLAFLPAANSIFHSWSTSDGGGRTGNPGRLTVQGPVTVNYTFLFGSSYTITPIAPVAAVRTAASSVNLSSYGSSSMLELGGVIQDAPSSSYRYEYSFAARGYWNDLQVGQWSPGGIFGGWRSLGGVIKGIPAISKPVDARIHCAARDNWDGYWIISDCADTSGEVHKWIFIGGAFSTDPQMVTASDGTIYLMGKDRWDALWMGRYHPSTGFLGWQPGGGVIKGTPSMTLAPDGVIYVAGRDRWGAMYMARYLGEQWHSWHFGGGGIAGDPVAVARADGSTVSVVVRDNWGGLWQRQFLQGMDAAWQPWQFIGGVVDSFAAADGGDSLYVAGRSGTGRIYWWRSKDATWTVSIGTGPLSLDLTAAPR